ncbi:hypothetical protein DPMN_025461 [Dreissena polymorpha]|uniref:Uncharacterized protein n=1 Tax=Dreissena polymorpha TaxID=45954 RepID=A0A9D4LRF4_DREPO|nr:hypothetical protein DPMN_025461 [Dreissena polymorpha]
MRMHSVLVWQDPVRQYDGDNAIIRWRERDNPMTTMRQCDDDSATIRWRQCDSTMVTMR